MTPLLPQLAGALLRLYPVLSPRDWEHQGRNRISC
jgi:hypothetical protein